MLDAEVTALLERGVRALERLADHFAPAEETRQRQPATLGTAKYTREEKDREEFRKTFRKQEPESPF